PRRRMRSGRWMGSALARPMPAPGAPRRARRPRSALAGAEPLLPVPAVPYPATVIVSRTVGANAAVAFRGNFCSVPPGLAGAQIECRNRLGTGMLEICSPSGARLACHRLAPDGAGTLVRTPGHHAEPERVVQSAFTTDPPCRRKGNHPPGAAARAEPVRLLAGLRREVAVGFGRYADLAAPAHGPR